MFKISCFLIYLFCSVCSVAQLQHKLDSLLQPTLNEPGFALLIENNGKILYKKIGGLANIETGERINEKSNFRMASITKQFTAMGILLLEKAHKLSLENSIGQYFPELPADIGDHVLIKHLLTHSSGLLDYEELISATQTKQVLDNDVLQLLKDHDTTYFLPGSRFRYSNSGFCLLALIIERVSHQSFSAFIKENIFTPLKMNNSIVYENGLHIARRAMGYSKDSIGKVIFSDQSVTSATRGDGGVYTSLTDYLKWIHALQQNKLLNLQNVLQHIRFTIASSTESYYAAGWFQTGSQQEILFHSGSTCGFNNYVIEVPKRRLSIIYFSNLADNVNSFKAIVRIIKESGFGNFGSVFTLHDLTN